MNKTQLVDVLADRLGNRRTAVVAVNGVLDTIVTTVGAGEPVAILGFGVFEGRTRVARTARNPRTGAAVAVPATTVPAFRAGAGFRAAVAAGTSSAKESTATGSTATGSTAGARRRPVAPTARSTAPFVAPLESGEVRVGKNGSSTNPSGKDGSSKNGSSNGSSTDRTAPVKPVKPARARKSVTLVKSVTLRQAIDPAEAVESKARASVKPGKRSKAGKEQRAASRPAPAVAEATPASGKKKVKGRK